MSGMATMRAAQRMAPLFRHRLVFSQSTAAAGLRSSTVPPFAPHHSVEQSLGTMLPEHSVKASARLVSCISMGSVRPVAQGYFVSYVSPY